MRWMISVRADLRLPRLHRIPVAVAGGSPVARLQQAPSARVVPEVLGVQVDRSVLVVLVVLSIPAVRNVELPNAQSPSVERYWADLIGQVLIPLSSLELRYL